MRGRKPTPTVLRILRGNPGKRRLNVDEPQPEDLSQSCPDELDSETARKEWARTIVPAIHTRQITSADRTMAVAHCELYAQWRDQLATASKHPHIVAVGKHNYPTPNPARVMANKTLMMLAKVDAELGLSPTSRSRVTKGKGAATPDKRKERFFGTGGR